MRAFLEASEIVEIEEEVLDDILDSFGDFDEASDDSHDTAAGENIPVPVRNFGRDVDAAGNIELPLPYGFYVFFGPQEPTPPRWTRQQINGMLAHLKQRGLSSFMKEYVITRATPIPELLCAFDIYLCEELQRKNSATLVYFLQVVLSGELQLRERLSRYGTLQDAVNLITSSRRILVLTGAGISVSCGIPDFRSRNGLYATLKEKEEYDLDDPQQMFDISYFKENPSAPLQGRYTHRILHHRRVTASLSSLKIMGSSSATTPKILTHLKPPSVYETSCNAMDLLQRRPA